MRCFYLSHDREAAGNGGPSDGFVQTVGAYDNNHNGIVMIAAIRTDLTEALADLSEKFKLDALYAFGSRSAEIAARVRGEINPPVTAPGSDVDIGVLPERGHRLTVEDRVALMLSLEDLFDVSRVDVVLLPHASAFLARDVVSGDLLHTRDAYAEATYQLYALRRAADLAPLVREDLQRWLAEIGPARDETAA